MFAKLDRLSGDRLSIFYLHRGGEKSIEKFNAQFLTTLDVHEIAGLPCVVFFKFKDDQIEDVQVVQLDNANLIHGFFELFTVVENYLDHAAKKPSESRGLKWIKSGSKFIGIEAFRAALRQSLDNWF
ncbi:hypothetical protein LF41_2269 [Lysobacter dokdonensis DS-58]|uniref:Uncharacterized protein n=1 Tax=Lysobacter dokdonensis DS-58 TaxID=1300345 RepID=A0A0A2WM17_9GAMM|nr:hypothetical protein LF41_2269 [Lysobacter dokdonensis DS-58]